MRIITITLGVMMILVVAGCAKVKPIEFEEEPVTPVQTVEQESPTVESEIPTTTDQEIVTQSDTSL